MKKNFLKILVFVFALSVTGSVLAVSKKQVSEYFTYFDKLQELPPGAKKIRFMRVDRVE